MEVEQETDCSNIYGAPNRQTEKADTKKRDDDALNDDLFSFEKLKLKLPMEVTEPRKMHNRSITDDTGLLSNLCNITVPMNESRF